MFLCGECFLSLGSFIQIALVCLICGGVRECLCLNMGTIIVHQSSHKNKFNLIEFEKALLFYVWSVHCTRAPRSYAHIIGRRTLDAFLRYFIVCPTFRRPFKWVNTTVRQHFPPFFPFVRVLAAFDECNDYRKESWYISESAFVTLHANRMQCT